MTGTIYRLFEIASPTTLAELIADIRMLGTGAETVDLDIEREAYRSLCANVGKVEADAAIAKAVQS